jgi:hypothetical protein
MQQLIKMNKASVVSSIAAIKHRLRQNYSTHYINCIQRPSHAALASASTPPLSVRFSTSVAYDVFTPTDQFMARHMGSQGDKKSF